MNTKKRDWMRSNLMVIRITNTILYASSNNHYGHTKINIRYSSVLLPEIMNPSAPQKTLAVSPEAAPAIVLSIAIIAFYVIKLFGYYYSLE